MVQEIINCGADYRMTDMEGQTPLHYAVNSDNAPVVEFYHKIDSENFLDGLIVPGSGSEISY